MPDPSPSTVSELLTAREKECWPAIADSLPQAIPAAKTLPDYAMRLYAQFFVIDRKLHQNEVLTLHMHQNY